MTVDRTTSSPQTTGPHELAATARSILACPAGVNLVVDGVDDVLAGMDDLGHARPRRAADLLVPP